MTKESSKHHSACCGRVTNWLQEMVPLLCHSLSGWTGVMTILWWQSGQGTFQHKYQSVQEIYWFSSVVHYKLKNLWLKHPYVWVVWHVILKSHNQYMHHSYWSDCRLKSLIRYSMYTDRVNNCIYPYHALENSNLMNVQRFSFGFPGLVVKHLVQALLLCKPSSAQLVDLIIIIIIIIEPPQVVQSTRCSRAPIN